jgi:hypothetical protein
VPDDTKSAKAWRVLFETLNVINKVETNGFVDLTADQLRVVREPRLLTKIDHETHLPAVFAENGLGILTLSGSSWRIGKFNTFQKLTAWAPPAPHVMRVSVPAWLESLSPDLITGEGAAINAADACGVLEHFCGQTLVSTITGKGGSGDFDFVIGPVESPYNISVRGAQIEVDGGFEGEGSLCLFEAKRHICSDFNIRQLYYPMRAWSSRVRKPVRTLFFTFANNVFDLHEFGFADPLNFSSIQLLRHERYLLSSASIDLEALRRFAATHKNQLGAAMHLDATSAGIPCPQADDLERVIDLTAFLAEEPSTKQDIAARYPIVPRQVDYYLGAARYLKLVSESGSDSDGAALFGATALSLEILRQPNHLRLLRLAEVILLYGPLSTLYSEWRATGIFPSKGDVIEQFRQSPASSQLSEDTLIRRSTTIRMWLKWICELDSNGVMIPEVELELD